MLITAPAKINLTLDITGRRADGYHLLDTVMQTVSLCDEIELSLTGNGDITLFLQNTDLQPDAKNTAYRAAEVFFRETGLSNPGIAITVTKQIPMQAGMGGGSADAAGVLVGLNALFDTHLSVQELCRIGLFVGADVPFCIFGGTARATGVGEVLTSLSSMPNCTILIAKPSVGVSTAAAYNAVDAHPFGSGISSDLMAAALGAQDIAAVGRHIYNAFERALCLTETNHICEVARSCGSFGCQMTGSGSAVFALFPSDEAAQSCRKQLESEGLFVSLCRPVSTGAVVVKR